MNGHDIVKELSREKGLVEKLSPKFKEHDLELEELMAQAENPKVLAMLMFKLIQDKEKTNKLLESINDKYDRIMFSLKAPESMQQQNFSPQQGFSAGNRFETLAEQDQLILKLVEEKGGCTAKDIKTMLNYKGLNAACQRLNKLFREGHLKKVQSGRKVLYLAKS